MFFTRNARRMWRSVSGVRRPADRSSRTRSARSFNSASTLLSYRYGAPSTEAVLSVIGSPPYRLRQRGDGRIGRIRPRERLTGLVPGTLVLQATHCIVGVSGSTKVTIV